ncbi:site-specific DNA-methyltransferase [Pendulispora brunnea]|uniref:Methyltransferase n=1 Tax=Pendulispora brunnea TaxID=2905690 RepID=A0ABZ2KJW7_9BACT
MIALPCVNDVLDGRARWTVINGDCLALLPGIPNADVAILDTAYSRRVHEGARTSRRRDLPDVAKWSCRKKRRLDLGFEHLTPKLRRGLARWCGERVRRWTLAFSDAESSWLWRLSLVAAGLNHRRTGEWDRLGGAPQFSGIEPAPASEHITICHRRGRRRWNGGGKAARWSHPVVANRLGARGSRVHPTQKPEGLLVDLVSDFADPDDVVIDPVMGSGTTGVAAIRLGRRFIGIELNRVWFEIALERLRAEEAQSTLQAARAGQQALFENWRTS